ncbi:MAG TPA: nucleoside monophosphate kinase [Candidatus Acidoferrum sp.]|nr:nucleoside monophosphate kinase [Candidatus Acidoferrum sp.]
MKYRTILLFGAPGAGKGTQGKILGSIPNFHHFASGDVFRRLTPETELGRLFLDYSGRGELVPDEPTIRLCREHLEAAARDGRFDPVNDTLVLDGIPRNPNQARLLSPSLDVRLVLYLSCSDMDKMVLRLQRRALKENRLDDADPAVIRKRLEVFEAQSKPVLDYYGPDLRCDIDATQTPIKVSLDILQAVEERLG